MVNWIVGVLRSMCRAAWGPRLGYVGPHARGAYYGCGRCLREVKWQHAQGCNFKGVVRPEDCELVPR